MTHLLPQYHRGGSDKENLLFPFISQHPYTICVIFRDVTPNFTVLGIYRVWSNKTCLMPISYGLNTPTAQSRKLQFRRANYNSVGETMVQSGKLQLSRGNYGSVGKTTVQSGNFGSVGKTTVQSGNFGSVGETTVLSSKLQFIGETTAPSGKLQFSRGNFISVGENIAQSRILQLIRGNYSLVGETTA